MRSSPSFLDEMYSKFNLREDTFNLGTVFCTSIDYERYPKKTN